MVVAAIFDKQFPRRLRDSTGFQGSMMGEESEDDFGGLSPTKRTRLSHTSLLNHLISEVSEIKTCMDTRLTSLETKAVVLVQMCNKLYAKIDNIEKLVSKQEENRVSSSKAANQPVLVRNVSQGEMPNDDTNGHMQVLTLNREEDYPNGSWLGDPSVVSKRVRCPITPQNLLHINSTCISPWKMALTLLDYLFTKEELSTSNLSGRSKWNKRQLDPLMIYGIRCHLQSKFGISARDWHKICLNMDSKCRSAWKRRVKGLVNPNRPNRAPQIGHSSSLRKNPEMSDVIPFDFENLQSSNLDLSDVKVIQSPVCELRVLNATPEQFAHLQDNQEIILSEEPLLSASSDGKGILISQSSSVGIGTEGISEDLNESQLSPDLGITAGQVTSQADLSSGRSGTLNSGVNSSTLHHNIDMKEESHLTLQDTQERNLDEDPLTLQVDECQRF
ncbi:uncharacterized protein LOC143020015 isoform X2 [Oratosquilla oratoria]|uniref:uncharacterized protein LOC143020015 isoform X2 n=1 Tax=Oratosquilla oratoria TaxID=337810 RepID=UPI003F769F97